jgi:hypothetical protein
VSSKTERVSEVPIETLNCRVLKKYQESTRYNPTKHLEVNIGPYCDPTPKLLVGPDELPTK